MRKLQAAAIIMLITSAMISGQTSATGTFSSVEKRKGVGGEQVARVVIKTKPFERSRHILKYTNTDQSNAAPGESKLYSIDNRFPLGSGAKLPETEIESITVFFNKRRVVVPRRLYEDCYNLKFENEHFATKFGEDERSLLVYVTGGQSGSGYQVMWVLRSDGRHSRFISNCSDCDSKNIISFFMKEKQ
jgi:hypothetical protein